MELRILCYMKPMTKDDQNGVWTYDENGAHWNPFYKLEETPKSKIIRCSYCQSTYTENQFGNCKSCGAPIETT